MSCPECQSAGGGRASRKALWIALVAVIVVGAIGVAEVAGGRSERKPAAELLPGQQR